MQDSEVRLGGRMVRALGRDAGGRDEEIGHMSHRERAATVGGGGTHNSSLSHTHTTTVRVMTKGMVVMVVTQSIARFRVFRL